MERYVILLDCFREPIIMKNVPRYVQGWTKPICIGRHAFGDQYRAADTVTTGKGNSPWLYPDDGGTPKTWEVYSFQENGVAMCMYNIDSSIYGFARSCMNQALKKDGRYTYPQKYHYESIWWSF